MKKMILILILLSFIVGCVEQTEESEEGQQLANPASVYCEEQGGILRIEENEIGQYGVCTLRDGTECEEWAYYRNECPEEEQQTEPEVIEELEIICQDYEGDKEECSLHTECGWDAEENHCDPIGGRDQDDDYEEGEETEFASGREKGLPGTIPNEICKKLPLTNKLNPGDRHYCLALVNHDAGFCENIDDEEKEVNRCLAHATGDSSYCEILQDEASKHVCYYMLAVSSENADFCSEIDYSQHEKEQCYFTFISNLYWFDKSDEITTEQCSQLGDPDGHTCLALKSRDVSLCKNNVNCLTFFEQPMSFCDEEGSLLKDCVRDRAMTSKDVSICEELSGEQKDDCIGDFCTHIQLDITLCDKITNLQERQSRYVEVAMNLGNDVREAS
ncbi:MAG: DUF333 domain-containing protein [Nanoarchaeota archaeon]